MLKLTLYHTILTLNGPFRESQRKKCGKRRKQGNNYRLAVFSFVLQTLLVQTRAVTNCDLIPLSAL